MCRCAARLFGIVVYAAVLTAGTSHALAQTQGQSREPWIVTTAWLQEHLNDPGLVVIQVAGTRREFSQGHLPGARFLWAQAYAPSTPDGSYDLPTAAQATAIFQDLGLRPDSRIVLVYSGTQVQQTARAFLTFDQFGLGRRLSIMNGGFDAWKAEGRPVSIETPQVLQGTAVAATGGTLVADAAYVQARINQATATIVDARETRFFRGEGGGQPRPGHIPSAVSVPFISLIDGTRIKDEAALREVFMAAGVKPGTEVVSYCHIGQQGSLVWLAARMLGYDARLYDGSFEDWSGREDLPIVNPAADKKRP
ncbi:MAG: rhodanese-like domain-containing protein [Acidobacteria bacterium]|nr:rhodanese-like domain-containing protein [Acidobacteriota bacterium]